MLVILFSVLIISAATVVCYFRSTGGQVLDNLVYWAMGLMVLYLVLFGTLAAIPNDGKMRYWANLFILLPQISFIAILFPQLNLLTPESLTRGWGVFGLGVTIVILLLFRWLVWPSQ